MSPPSAQARFAELAARVDAMFARAAERYASAVQCTVGCTDCCAGELSVTLVEARAIADALACMSVDERQAVAAGARTNDVRRCAALDGEGGCRIYASRPLVCRSHGLPIRGLAEGARAAELSTCPHNFRERPHATEVDADCILDQQTLSTVLGAIDMAFADEQGFERGVRIAIADLLSEPGHYFELAADPESEV